MSAALFIIPSSVLLFTNLNLCTSLSSGCAFSPASAAAKSKCGGSVAIIDPNIDELDAEEDEDASDGENSLSRLERFRGGGGWKGCEAAEGDGEGGREA
jgi:hypothetical protein